MIFSYQKQKSSIAPLITSIQDGINAGLRPKLTDEGTSGTYLMRGPDQKQPIAIFKPIDEE